MRASISFWKPRTPLHFLLIKDFILADIFQNAIPISKKKVKRL